MHDLQTTTFTFNEVIRYIIFVSGVVSNFLLTRQAVRNLENSCKECKSDFKEKICKGESCLTNIKSEITEHNTMIEQHEKRLDKHDLIIERRKQ